MYDAIYDLKEMLCKQLNDYGKKGELTAAILERVDMLSHAVKNLDHIIDHMEDEKGEYSGNMGGRSYRGDYRDGVAYRDGDGHSMARGRNAKRDSMGRYSNDGYSRDDDMADQLRSMADMTPDSRTRQELNRLASQMEGR